ncbi:N-Dimethylarginine dimethylaminohydrolase [Saccharopolyspora shandongensis]|uniref:N-Dimethylarginine dimethylaminohydrolase n=1 Tax=Saccharopolyspora shandongensis TaxID=418495 RepID=A0A1H3C530_9PSEU|nr:dimethylargininase [Saccharopolyspora shandongensis]SDX49175.1 N-Dimethylarginine dimethylaminohydrolase [Saccharopolyspora shandongensis]
MTVTAGPALETLAPPQTTTRHYVMCAPKYFTVEYSINPWMDPGTPVEADLAMAQWAELKRTYERLGHVVELVEPQPGLPDMVFAANSATVIDDRVLGARFRAPQRAAEAEHFRRWFVTRGYRNLVMPSRINEAEGDFAWTGRVLLAGSGFRTDPEAHAEAQEVLGVPVVSLRLVDPRYYHLDTALFVLERGERAQIAYFPDAFSPGSRRVLERMFPDAVIADATDAACLGLNGVSDGRHVVLPAEATGLAAQLAARGYEPVLLDISELRKSGGGPKCCTMELHA